MLGLSFVRGRYRSEVWAFDCGSRVFGGGCIAYED